MILYRWIIIVLSVSIVILGYRVYTRELNNASMASSSPNMAPTLASENAVGRGNIAGCQAGDLSCDMGGMYITTYSSIYLSICLFTDLSIWLALLVYLLAS